MSYLQFVVALVFVLALIAALAWAARRFGLAPRVTISGASKGNKRLAIVEVLAVDARRRLLLIRRDDTEHLVLIGAERDTVVETGIAATDRSRPGGAA